MSDFYIDDVVFDLHEASAFLKLSERAIRARIKDGRIRAAKSGGNGGGKLQILKSSCLAYIHRQQQDHAVNADDGRTEEQTVWQSNKGTVSGTVISLLRTESALDKALEQRTKGKPRNYTTN
ncbi:hypothetical protein [Martelella alba]|uniref:hypothetical protein n=1 Tax=Martelella alba TaxID=2590451 RepID=UPI001E3E0C82|nr:hypothetical protein [Martelella alba]